MFEVPDFQIISTWRW